MPHDGMNTHGGHAMLKEVGASGQISLGKKYAGQLFEVEVQADGSIVMRPVKVVPMTLAVRETPAPYDAQASTRQWADTHATEIDQYNAWASEHEPYAQRVKRWREQGGA
jgi:hypothetical protein